MSKKGHTPENTAKRLAAFRVAAARPGYSRWSTGPKSADGKRKVSMNGIKHGGDGLAYKFVMAYAGAVLSALTGI